jgi:biopolymer transport protein ExbD
MRKKKSAEAPVVEANVLPVMNVMFLLIPALLLAMEVASMAAITVVPPRDTSSVTNPQPTEPNLELKVRVASDGFWVTVNEQLAKPTPEGPTVARIGEEEYDYAALEATARDMKAAHPEESSVYVTAEADVPLSVIVGTMDALRGSDCELASVPAGHEPPADCLFWRPVVQSL